MFSIAPALSGFAAGVVTSFWLDPSAGRRRRALVRDKLYSMGNEVADDLAVVARDFAHRSRGVAYSAASLFTADDADDHVIVERVRAELGFLVSHPRSLEVSVRDGRATLEGPILADERDRLIAGIRRVRGVREVDADRLEVHEKPDIPALQGGTERRGRVPDVWQRRWSPTTRFLVGASGLALAAFGLRNRTSLGIAGATLGLSGLARAFTNRELRRLASFGNGARGR